MFNWWAVNLKTETFWKQPFKTRDCFWIMISIKSVFYCLKLSIMLQVYQHPDHWCHCRCFALTANRKHLLWHHWSVCEDGQKQKTSLSTLQNNVLPFYTDDCRVYERDLKFYGTWEVMTWNSHNDYWINQKTEEKRGLMAKSYITFPGSQRPR